MRWSTCIVILVAVTVAMCQSQTVLEPESTTTTGLPRPTSSSSMFSSTAFLMSRAVSPTPMDIMGSGSAGLEPFPMLPTSLPVTPLTFITIAEANLTTEFVGDGLCDCDLLVGQCDVHCCCDKDCSLASRTVFSCSTTSSSEVCLDFDGLFRTSLDRCSCAESSLLCVVFEQDHSRLGFGAALVVESTNQFSNLESQYTLPSDRLVKTLEQPVYSDVYSVGVPVLVLLGNGTMSYTGTFTLPAPLNGMQCHDGNPITYLNNLKYTCERTLLPSTCELLSASCYYESLHLLQGPSNMDLTSPVLLSSVSCNNQPCQLTATSNASTCNNAVTEAFYTFFHDGGGQLLNASVALTLGNVEATFTQRFEVRFAEDIDPDVPQLRRSGNPGYSDGEVVLAGSLTEMDIIDISIDNNLWLHVKESTRRCSDERPKMPVRFKQDLYTTCLMRVSVSDAINDCADVRSMAYSVLNPVLPLTHVGRYGNSDPSNVSEWISIINETTGSTDEHSSSVAAGFAQVSVLSLFSISQISSRLLCSNVPTSLEITILFSNTGDFGSPQPVIAGVRMTYFTQNIVPELIRNGHMVMITAVQFIDITSEANQVLSPIEGAVMELPQDFLYPFFFSHASSLRSDIMDIFLVTCIMLNFFITQL